MRMSAEKTRSDRKLFPLPRRGGEGQGEGATPVMHHTIQFSLGSVITPVMAEAAATAGEHR